MMREKTREKAFVQILFRIKILKQTSFLVFKDCFCMLFNIFYMRITRAALIW